MVGSPISSDLFVFYLFILSAGGNVRYYLFILYGPYDAFFQLTNNRTHCFQPLAWIYVADNHLNEAEWFCKVDYDTYFFPENLQYYVRDLKNWDAYNEHHYFGLVLGHRPHSPDMIAGAAACWSHKTLDAIADVYRKMPKGRQGMHRNKCEDRPEASEEISTSLCLYDELNVTAHSMVDDQMRQYVVSYMYGMTDE